MTERKTEELLNEITHAKGADQFMTDEASNFVHFEPAEYLVELLQIKHQTRSKVLQAANIPASIGYQYFDGKRRPSRARIIALGFGFQLTLAEMNTMLKRTGFAALYAKDEWDALIIFALAQHYDLNKTDELLYEYGLGTISADN